MIAVFGSINADISVATARPPAPGETVLGGAALLSPGGKGANQAHAARRFGSAVRMFGAVGCDAFAAGALQSLVDAGVDTAGVAAVPGQATGLALIVLDAQGENSIVVAPGANLAARAEQLPDQVLRDSGALLLQLETDAAETMALARRARRLGCRVLLNASPLQQAAQLDLDAIDILIVNQEEWGQLARLAGVPEGAPASAALALAHRHNNEVLVTLGAQGALLVGSSGRVERVPALPVRAIDTTGAGDTFAGVFAAALANGESRLRAMEYAAAAAALACGRRGAQIAQPLRAEIEQLLASRGTAAPQA
jgi:ribokinase